MFLFTSRICGLNVCTSHRFTFYDIQTFFWNHLNKTEDLNFFMLRGDTTNMKKVIYHIQIPYKITITPFIYSYCSSFNKKILCQKIPTKHRTLHQIIKISNSPLSLDILISTVTVMDAADKLNKNCNDLPFQQTKSLCRTDLHPSTSWNNWAIIAIVEGEIAGYVFRNKITQLFHRRAAFSFVSFSHIT